MIKNLEYTMSLTNEQKIVIDGFNRILKKIMDTIMKWYPNQTELIDTFDLVKAALKTNYRAGIEAFNLTIYNKYSQRILAGDESFFAELDLKQASSKLVYKFISPLKSLYLEAESSRRQIMFNYVKKMIKLCEIYRRLRQ